MSADTSPRTARPLLLTPNFFRVPVPESAAEENASDNGARRSDAVGAGVQDNAKDLGTHPRVGEGSKAGANAELLQMAPGAPANPTSTLDVLEKHLSSSGRPEAVAQLFATTRTTHEAAKQREHLSQEENRLEVDMFNQEMESLPSCSLSIKDDTGLHSMGHIGHVDPADGNTAGSKGGDTAAVQTKHKGREGMEKSHQLKANKARHPDTAPVVSTEEARWSEEPGLSSSERVRPRSAQIYVSPRSSPVISRTQTSGDAYARPSSYLFLSLDSSIKARNGGWENSVDDRWLARSIADQYPSKEIYYYNSTPDVRKAESSGSKSPVRQRRRSVQTVKTSSDHQRDSKARWPPSSPSTLSRDGLPHSQQGSSLPSPASLSPDPSPSSSIRSAFSLSPLHSATSLQAASTLQNFGVDDGLLSLPQPTPITDLVHGQTEMRQPVQSMDLSPATSPESPEAIRSASSYVIEPASSFGVATSFAISVPTPESPELPQLFTSNARRQPDSLPSLQLTDIPHYTKLEPEEEKEKEKEEEEEEAHFLMRSIPTARMDSVVNDLNSAPPPATPALTLGGEDSMEVRYGVNLNSGTHTLCMSEPEHDAAEPSTSPSADLPEDLSPEIAHLTAGSAVFVEDIFSTTRDDEAIARALQEEEEGFATGDTITSSSSLVSPTSRPSSTVNTGLTAPSESRLGGNVASHVPASQSEEDSFTVGNDRTTAQATQEDHHYLNDLSTGEDTPGSTAETMSPGNHPGYGVHLGPLDSGGASSQGSLDSVTEQLGAGADVPEASLGCSHDYAIALCLQQEYDAEIAQQMQLEDSGDTSRAPAYDQSRWSLFLRNSYIQYSISTL